MNIAILLFDNVTALDAIGPYETLGRVPGARLTFVAKEPGEIRTDQRTLTIKVEAGLEDVAAPEIVVVPGGFGQVALMHDTAVLDWLRAVDSTSTWTTSVCTGALLLGAAGLLQGRRATTHWLAVDQLEEYGATHSHERVVVDGKYVTAAGVSAAIDMGLTLAARIAGDDVAQIIQLGIEYDPHPPHTAGSPATAPAQVIDFVQARRNLILKGQPR